jgi:hypothetical protein
LPETQQRVHEVVVPRHDVADAHPAQRVALADRIHHDDEVVHAGEGERRVVRGPVVDELAVDLVGDQVEPAVAADRGEQRHLLVRVHGAGRVVRRADEDRARLVRQRGLDRGAPGR